MSKPRVVGFVQARLTSTRLPNKVLATIGSWTVIELMLTRLLRSKYLDQIVFVIPDTSANDRLHEYLTTRLNALVYRGDEHDVLLRFAKAAELYPADYYVRMTADCPVICPEIVDDVIQLVLDEKTVYGSNVNPPTFPDGFDVECIASEALTWTHNHVKDMRSREHVTLGLRESKERPTSWHFSNLTRPDESTAWIRLTVDCPEDLEVLKTMAELDSKVLCDGKMKDLEELYVKANLHKKNGMIERNSGMTRPSE